MPKPAKLQNTRLHHACAFFVDVEGLRIEFGKMMRILPVANVLNDRYEENLYECIGNTSFRNSQILDARAV